MDNDAPAKILSAASGKRDASVYEESEPDSDDSRIIVKKKKSGSSSKLSTSLATTRVLRQRPVIPPKHRCYVEIPPHPLHRNNNLQRIAANRAQAQSQRTASSLGEKGKQRVVRRDTSPSPGPSSAPRHSSNVKKGPPYGAVGKIRPETYFWPITTVMRRRVQKYIEGQRDALTALEAELLALHREYELEQKSKSDEVLDLVAQHREQELDFKKKREEILGLD